jgi:hypothetical protein
MQSITKTYLTDIIFRMVNPTIQLHRQSKKSLLYYDHPDLPASDEEIAEFIISIPYLDDRLKDFLFGNISDETIIISQAWETEFVKKCILWVRSFEWIDGAHSYLNDAHLNSIKKNAVCLTLPY